jgi:glycosyltransferase involved in cell wall biosynthesis
MITTAAVRILLVINGLDFGGTERAVEQLALRVTARAHEVRVLTLKPPGRIGRALEARGVPVTTLGMSEVAGLGDLARGAVALGRIVRQWRADVVHSFLPRANIVSRLGNRLAGGRAIHVSGERSTDCRRAPRVVRLNRWTARWTDLVLAVSPLVREVLVARDRIPRERIAVLENGIDLAAVDAIAPVAVRDELPALATADVVFSSVGRFVPEKGFVHLVRAFARMRRGEGAHLLLVGEGPEEAAVQAAVREHDVTGRVHLTGYRSDVLGVLKGTDAYVLSSVEEGSPMVVLEAMACGVPTIATDVSGVRELADASAAEPVALVVPPAVDWSAALLGRREKGSEAERVEVMAQAMDRLAASSALRRTLGAAGRRRVETYYTLDHVVQRLLDHYRSVRHG